MGTRRSSDVFVLEAHFKKINLPPDMNEVTRSLSSAPVDGHTASGLGCFCSGLSVISLNTSRKLTTPSAGELVDK